MQPADRVIARYDFHAEAVDRRMLVDEELHAIEGRRTGASIGPREGKVDPDPDHLRRGPRETRGRASEAHDGRDSQHS